MVLIETYTLSNGVIIPKLGLGTWRIEDGQVAEVVRDAAKIGYRHFDTAQAYGNERGVGEGVRTCGVARDALFVTTKVDAAIKTYADAKASIDRSLQALGLDHLDLMIIHSPQPWTDFRESDDRYFQGNLEVWRALEEAYMAGKLRAIGVSNFERVDLQNILDNGTIKPAVNQILAHVGATPFDLIEYCEGEGVLVEAYSPVAHGEILNNRDLGAMASQYGVTVPQLCIRYCLELGLLPLPKTTNTDHMRTNAAFDFEISNTDLEALKTAERFTNYGEASFFPVFGRQRRAGAVITAQSAKGRRDVCGSGVRPLHRAAGRCKCGRPRRKEPDDGNHPQGRSEGR
jgi:diketogulonate reductase-like aldo/keto reductase